MHLIISCTCPACFDMHWQLLGDKFEVEWCSGAVRYMHATAWSDTILIGAAEVLRCLQMFLFFLFHLFDLKNFSHNDVAFAESVWSTPVLSTAAKKRGFQEFCCTQLAMASKLASVMANSRCSWTMLDYFVHCCSYASFGGREITYNLSLTVCRPWVTWQITSAIAFVVMWAKRHSSRYAKEGCGFNLGEMLCAVALGYSLRYFFWF